MRRKTRTKKPLNRMFSRNWKRALLFRVAMGIVLLASPLATSPLFASDGLDDAGKFREVMAMYAEYRSEFSGIEEIEAVEALTLVGDPGVVFVDVREPEEQAVSMIPGALTSEVFLADTERYRDQRIIVYCTISYRSGKLAAKMARKDIKVINLEGGLLAWVHAGGPLVRGYRPVNELHVYGHKWDLAPSGVETFY